MMLLVPSAVILKVDPLQKLFLLATFFYPLQMQEYFVGHKPFHSTCFLECQPVQSLFDLLPPDPFIKDVVKAVVIGEFLCQWLCHSRTVVLITGKSLIAFGGIGTGRLYRIHQFTAYSKQGCIVELMYMVLQMKDDFQRVGAISLCIETRTTNQVLYTLNLILKFDMCTLESLHLN